ncbi:MAG: transposase, partial [Planctomycetes bacterium]|nr:transposase [Planctomycetota bacterium]
MREVLDEVFPKYIRPSFKDVYRKLQRGKALEQMVFMEGCYLLSLDGTGFYFSEKISSDSCLEKRNNKTGEVIGYYMQMLGGSIVNPDYKEVIPLCPEMIIKQDGQNKNDCERNAAKRFFEHLRREHPHLPLIITEDALSPNAPHIRDLKSHNLHFILGVKPGDHTFLFNHVNNALLNGGTTEFELKDKDNPEITHRFRFLNNVPLNASNQDLEVNFLEYWEITEKKTKHFSWVTDFTITRDNAYQIMRGGRARWKIENETFNTLKNQGYNFGHNYGLGKKHLSTIFVMLMMLAFLVDQTQQLCCTLFRSV